MDTSNLVHEAPLCTLERLDRIEVRGPGGFEAYVRRPALDRLRVGIRRSDRRGEPDGVEDTQPSQKVIALELAVGVKRCERALAALCEEDRRLSHLRIELDDDFDAIAAIAARPNREVAPVAVRRALHERAPATGRDV